MKAYWCKASLFLLALSGYAFAQSDAPSLADIARQSRAGKKKAAIELSDEDERFSRSTTVAATSAAPNTGVSPQSSSAKPSSTPDVTKPAAPAQAKGASAASSAKQKLAYYKSELETWKGITSRDEALLAKETVPFRQQMYQDTLDGDRQTMTFFQQKVDEVESSLAKTEKTPADADTGSTSPSQE